MGNRPLNHVQSGNDDTSQGNGHSNTGVLDTLRSRTIVDMGPHTSAEYAQRRLGCSMERLSVRHRAAGQSISSAVGADADSMHIFQTSRLGWLV